MERRARKPVDSPLPFYGGRRFQTKRRTFRDAIDVLRTHGSFCEDDSARVEVASRQLPSRDWAHFVMIRSNSSRNLSVNLPTCSAVRATDTYGIRRAYSPEDFDEAQLDLDGNVTLANGLHLRTCEVVHMKLPIDWEHDRDSVVRQAISFLRAEKDCILEAAYDVETGWAGYLPLGSSAYQPKFRVLGLLVDYGAVVKLAMEAEKLEAFVAFHESHPLTERLYSRQTLAKILRDAGIRIPVSAEN